MDEPSQTDEKRTKRESVWVCAWVRACKTSPLRNQPQRPRLPYKQLKTNHLHVNQRRKTNHLSTTPPASTTQNPGDHRRTRDQCTSLAKREDGRRECGAAAQADDGLHPHGSRREGIRDRDRRRRGNAGFPFIAHLFEMTGQFRISAAIGEIRVAEGGICCIAAGVAHWSGLGRGSGSGVASS